LGKLPVVAVVGRPNVGKSTLFNRILHRKIAVVDDRSGVTRDRNYMEADWAGTDFVIVDTGGMIPDTKESMASEINHQVSIAIAEADAVLFLVAGDTEPTDLDEEIANRLRKICGNKVVLAANKAESPGVVATQSMYWSLGMGEPLGISALHGTGVGDMLDAIVQKIEEHYDPEVAAFEEYDLKVAIIGRPNAGKSSLVNRLLGDNRVIVTDIAGTTRDSIDTAFEHDGNKIKIIDTAGMRKKSRVKDDVEYYSNLRSMGSIHRCDLAILLIDTDTTISEQDMRIIRHVQKERRGLIICWNKWDIVDKTHTTFDDIVKASRAEFKELENIPMLSISALTGKRVHDVLNLAFKVREDRLRRISASELEETFFNWVKRTPHPFIPAEPVKFVGIKQQKSEYPHFIIFCRNKHRIEEAYIRFIKNKIYKTYHFTGSFLVVEFKNPGRKFGSDDGGNQSFQTQSFEV
jgi:GTP-binding protein